MDMISGRTKDSVIEEIAKVLIDTGTDGLKPIVELLLNASMKVEREHFLKAQSHERSDERMGHAMDISQKD